ncbi:hypothetical protein [Thalassotalea sp. PP2-459]|uniref:hypothetical protein n=1 Tax=Thalassotalea sp. PP2-459 TaxID=1742724 RepID=UPI000944792B|nr:hypothetical protein [Thalassotalea sp. PP2-459]OKY27729.1 hypothetical protein BI291_07865 [Thalassotalea sp. PP2-459]
MKINNKIIATFLSSIVLLGGCASTKAPQKTALEIQAIQSQQFESDKNIAFASVLSVFQDLGYIVKSADKDTGFITAQSATKNTTSFLAAMGGATQNTKTNATAFVELLKEGTTKIRLNFVVSNSASSAYGQNSSHDIVIEDPKVYQNAFNKIGDAIFIRKGS